MRIWPLLLLVACAEPEPAPTEFEQRCMELVRDVLPDVHAVLEDSVGRQVRVKESEGGNDHLSWVSFDAPGVIHLSRVTIEKRWQQRGVSDPRTRDRELTLLLARELARVYQGERQPWMTRRRDNWTSEHWSLPAAWIPCVGHSIFVSDEVARRRGWQPFRPSEGMAYRIQRLDEWFQRSWLYRRDAASCEGLADAKRDGAQFIESLVRRKGHAGAMRYLRGRPKLSNAEVLWLTEPEPVESGERLRALLSSTWGEVDVNRVHPRVLDRLLRPDQPDAIVEPGWQFYLSDSYGQSNSMLLFVFPTRHGKALVSAGRKANERLRQSVDVAALELVDAPGGFACASVVTSPANRQWTEVWRHDGDWLVVLIGSDLHGGVGWCDAWIENVLRVVRGGADTRFSSQAWAGRWQTLWERVAPLDERGRWRVLREYLDDKSEEIRALVTACGTGWLEDEQAFCARTRRDPSRLVRIAAGSLLHVLYYDDEVESENRALVESLLHDPDPFVRSGAIGYGAPNATEANWNRYWRLALTDPVIGLRGEAMELITNYSVGLDLPDRSRLLTAPVRFRPTVEASIRPLVDHALYDFTALEFLIRMGSTDESLWERLLAMARDREKRYLDAEMLVPLLIECPVPEGDRETALRSLLAEDGLRELAIQAGAVDDE